MKRLLAFGALTLLTTGCEFFVGDLDQTYEDEPAAGAGADGGLGGSGLGGSGPGGGGAGGQLQTCSSLPVGQTINFSYQNVQEVTTQWCDDDTGSRLTVPNGQVRLAPQVGDYWTTTTTAPSLYMEIDGNFGFRVDFRVANSSGPIMLPCGAYNGAGIIVRNPDQTTPDWLLFDLGRIGFDAGGLEDTSCMAAQVGQFGTYVYEVDTVVGGIGTFTATTNNELQVGVCRVGNRFTMYTRPNPSAMPTLVHDHTQGAGALPSLVQVGFTAHRFTIIDIIEMTVSAARIETAFSTEPDCVTALFSD